LIFPDDYKPKSALRAISNSKSNSFKFCDYFGGIIITAIESIGIPVTAVIAVKKKEYCSVECKIS